MFIINVTNPLTLLLVLAGTALLIFLGQEVKKSAAVAIPVVIAIVVFIACFFLGILFGNLFATCQTSSYFYSDVCVVTEFNFSLMLTIWFFSLLLCVFFFAIGHIIYYLKEINKKLNKIH